MKYKGMMFSIWEGLARQLVTYTGVGLMGTMAHYSTLLILVELLGLSPVSGSASGFIVGALVNYRLNYSFTFRSTAAHGVAMPKFMTVLAVGFGINYLMMLAGSRWTSLHYLIIQAAATATILFWGFAANSLWTFRSEQRGSG
jgi:putative flippase GtrA